MAKKKPEPREDPDIWRKIPTEEKLELMARAQSKGVTWCLVLVSTCAVVAVGLHIPWIFWSAFITIPFVFQFASAKAWRDIKPRAMLEYLAARSAARRYAFNARGKELSAQLIFRGELMQEFDDDHIQEAMEAMIEKTHQASVWITLFPDSIVVMSERAGGAKLEVTHPIDNKLTISAEGFDEASSDKFVRISYQTKKAGEKKYRLMSRHSAALLVFERKIRASLAHRAAIIAKQSAPAPDAVPRSQF